MRRIIAAVVLALAAQTVPAPAIALDGVHCAPSGDIVAYGDWECGTPSYFSPWNNAIRVVDDNTWAIKRSTSSFPRQGSWAGRFEVRKGDTPNSGSTSERAEVAYPGGIRFDTGDNYYYSMSVRFDSTWPHCTAGICIVAQWKGYDADSNTPMLYLAAPQGALGGGDDRLFVLHKAGDCTPDAFTCEYNAKYEILNGVDFRANQGKWIDLIFHIGWTPEDTGTIEIWSRLEGKSTFGSPIVSSVGTVPTQKRYVVGGQPKVPVVEARVGLYRAPTSSTHIVTHDSYCVARTLTAAQTCFT